MSETPRPDAGMPIEHVIDSDGYVWRVVRDGGMATRAHYAGIVSIGIAALERQSGPLLSLRTHIRADQAWDEAAYRDSRDAAFDPTPNTVRVHNHWPYRPVCNERLVGDRLRGACLNDDGTPASAPDVAEGRG